MNDVGRPGAGGRGARRGRGRVAAGIVGGTTCRPTTGWRPSTHIFGSRRLEERRRRACRAWTAPPGCCWAPCLDVLPHAGCLRAPPKGDVLVVWKLDRLGPNLAHWSTPCRTCRPAAWVRRVLAHHYRSRAQGRAGSRTEGRQEVQAVESSGAAGRALEPSRFAFEEPRYFIAESPVSKSVAIATDPPMSAMNGASTTPYASTSPSSAKKIHRRRPPPLLRNPGAIRARTFQRNGNCGLFGTIAGDDSGAFGLHGQLL